MSFNSKEEKERESTRNENGLLRFAINDMREAGEYIVEIIGFLSSKYKLSQEISKLLDETLKHTEQVRNTSL